MYRMRLLPAWVALSSPLLGQTGQTGFVNWESPHVHPLELTPDGTRLLAVNTADARLEVFDSAGASLAPLGSIPVGLDPVSVRAHGSSQAWVVNHVSDTVSVVDLDSLAVVTTLATDDEPCDVVFAASGTGGATGSPGRAFVTCQERQVVLVFELADLTLPPQRLVLAGEAPRALAASPDGARVYAAIFESGNGTTLLAGTDAPPGVVPQNPVGSPLSPYGGLNPPPNELGPGGPFEPPLAAGLPEPPDASLIVRRDAGGAWRDDNGADWTQFVSGAEAAIGGRMPGWTLSDHDLAVIDAQTLGVSYADGLMNLCMALAVEPASGAVFVAGTEATNEVRFEPNLTGTFVRVRVARVDALAPGGPQATLAADLNPHLDYSTSTLPQSERDRSIGDPRAMVWASGGARGFVAGMGSTNVVVIDASGARLGDPWPCASGPTGLALDEPGERLFVLGRFEAAISVLSTSAASPGLELERVLFHDSTPQVVRDGRPFLYDTHLTSGLGQLSCASCHVDGRWDRLAWELGNPAGELVDAADQNVGAGLPGMDQGPASFHPMKGPMATQTLVDIVGKEPFHWRGDKDGLEDFNAAFVNLLGDDELLDAAEMAAFKAFLATLTFPPNPYRPLSNALPVDLDVTRYSGPAGEELPHGNAATGLALFRTPDLAASPPVACVTCHTLPSGVGPAAQFLGASWAPVPPDALGAQHHAVLSLAAPFSILIKVPQLRSVAELEGFDFNALENTSGFGLGHDGKFDSPIRFLPTSSFANGGQEAADLLAFLLAFNGSDLPTGSLGSVFEPPGPASQDSHAAIGKQVTVALADAQSLSFAQQLLELADTGAVALAAKGRLLGLARGWLYLGDALWQSDRQVESLDTLSLLAIAQPGNELTITALPHAIATRIAIDRDADGWLDRDELDHGADPADPGSVPSCILAAPAPPAAVSAVALSTTSALVAWVAGDASAESFTVERAPEGSAAWRVVAVVPAGASSYMDQGLACGKGYQWRVAAKNCGGSSASVATAAETEACFGGLEKQALPVHVAGVAVQVLIVDERAYGGAKISIDDWEGNDVAGATVRVQWIGTTEEIQEVVTNAQGVAEFVSPPTTLASYCWAVLVLDVTGAGATFDATGATVQPVAWVGNECF
jgi:YVTN family beta-propeller protein